METETARVLSRGREFVAVIVVKRYCKPENCPYCDGSLPECERMSHVDEDGWMLLMVVVAAVIFASVIAFGALTNAY